MPEAERLKTLEDENGRLKRLLAEAPGPFTKMDACEKLLNDLQSTLLLTERDHAAAMRSNAEFLFSDRLV